MICLLSICIIAVIIRSEAIIKCLITSTVCPATNSQKMNHNRQLAKETERSKTVNEKKKLNQVKKKKKLK